jgi:hypothetical protein
VLHARRERLRRNAEAEARGESLWTAAFDQECRVRIAALFDGLDDSRIEPGEASIAADDALYLLKAEIGFGPMQWYASDIVGVFTGAANEVMPSAVEAVYIALGGVYNDGKAARFEEDLNVILSEHRVSFEMVDGQMVPFDDRLLHVDIVEPALTLLGNRQGWESVERSFKDALNEIGADPGDAITDAGTALQEALRVRGCTGNALGPLLRDAQSKGILAPHDKQLGDALQRLGDWVSADRSKKGDCHEVTTATRDDAWLAVHVVGALIVRLSKEDSRGVL